MRFLIWAWDYGTDSGGGIALHRLAHNLAQLGHEAFLTCHHTAPGWKGQPIGHRMHPAHSDTVITIYPEIVEENPFRASRVVRWLLNTPGFFGKGNGDGVYDDRDLVMTWDERFAAGRTSQGMLTAWRDLSHFKDRCWPRPFRQCWMARKGGGMGVPLDQHEPGAVCIDGYAHSGEDPDAYLINVFNQYQSFVCYDNNSLIPSLAGLCGVPDIRVVNQIKPLLTREDIARATEDSIRQTREFVALCERHWA